MAVEKRSGLARAMARYRSGIVAVALFSGLINILTLTGSLFMLAVYDKVLPSRSIPTLIALSLFAAMLYGFHGLFEVLRGRILSRVGSGLEEALGPRLFSWMISQRASGDPRVDASAPLRDAETLRGFSASPGPGALFDMPWIPVYLAICFAFHPLIGWTATGGALLLLALTAVTDLLTREPSRRVHGVREDKTRMAEECRRSAEVLEAMSITPALGRRWEGMQSGYLAQQQWLADLGNLLGTITKTTRLMMQSLVLAVGAYLVINMEASGGIMIAGSILMSRALAPIDLAVGHWRAFVTARQAWARLNVVTRDMSAAQSRMALPLPTRSLDLQKVSVAPPLSAQITAHDINVQLQAGDALGVIGTSGAGKSSLVRVIVGVWKPLRGAVRLDGIKMDQWPRDILGRAIGYLPQDVELIAGTVAENIARFQDAEPSEVIEAARKANVHELIAGLPDGYHTQVGIGGSSLSAGQRQRVALARAMFRDPFLLILDEPNSNLDGAGEAALADAIARARDRGAIVIVVAHRPSIMSAVNKVLFMGPNGQTLIGDRDAVLARVLGRDAIETGSAADPQALAGNRNKAGDSGAGAGVPQITGADDDPRRATAEVQ
jgi:ATP-binding cassette subfamily C protein